MYQLDTMINTVQDSKKQMVKMFVPNQKVSEPLTKFIDTETEYTKSVISNFSDTARGLMSTLNQDTWTNFWKDSFQNYTSMLKPTKS